MAFREQLVIVERRKTVTRNLTADPAI